MNLTQMGAAGCGCASKVDPMFLREVLSGLPAFSDERLLVGYDTSDDAAVYKISDELAMIQTLDVFPPVVDDPYEYGQIAAANAMSDVWAMGGRAVTALNIFMFPEEMDGKAVHAILEGGYDKAKEAGVVICGGHTIKDPIPKYGLSVSGFVHPEKILKNNGVKPGDALILTKPLGVGILNLARSGGVLEEETKKKAVSVMARLNKYAAEAAAPFAGIHACTDVTGFSLMGHGSEMQEDSGCSLVIETKKLPVIPEALQYADMGFVPKLSYMNRSYIGDKVYFEKKVPDAIKDILFDPQTSGGLLYAVSEKEAEPLLEALKAVEPKAAVIGYAMEQGEHAIYIR